MSDAFTPILSTGLSESLSGIAREARRSQSLIDLGWMEDLECLRQQFSDADPVGRNLGHALTPARPFMARFEFTLRCEFATAQAAGVSILLRPLNAGYTARFSRTAGAAGYLRLEIEQVPAAPIFPEAQTPS